MKCYVSLLCILSLFFAISHAAPAITAIGSQGSGADPTELLMRISDKFSQNIQVLRRFCPPLFQIIDNVVQNVTSQIFSVVGRVVLRSGLGGGGGGGETKVSVVLPTFPTDMEEDESTEVVQVSTTTAQIPTLDESFVRIEGAIPTRSTPSSSSSSEPPQELPLSVNEIRVDPDEQALYTSKYSSDQIDIRLRGSDDLGITTISPINENLQDNKTNPNRDEQVEENIAAIFKGIAELQAGTTTESDILNIKVIQEGEVINTISLTSPSTQARVKREAETSENDQEPAASGGNGPEPAEDLSDVAEEGDRDKRYSPFGGDAAHGGGSGNFLFDIVRLIAGSGATEESDEKEHGGVGAGGVAEIDVAKGADGYTEGIPGPITRLFVIANRGLANLVQDLILRLAQTSERIVNFKARLITALI